MIEEEEDSKDIKFVVFKNYDKQYKCLWEKYFYNAKFYNLLTGLCPVMDKSNGYIYWTYAKQQSVE